MPAEDDARRRPSRTAWDSDVEVALLDELGVIVAVNDAWRDFTHLNGGDPARTGVGMSYLAACATGDDDASRDVADAITAALSGDLPSPRTIAIPCDAPDRPRTFDVMVSARLADDDRYRGATVSLAERVAAPEIRVLLCEDQSIYLAGLRTLLSAAPGIVVLGAVRSLWSGLELGEEELVDLIVIVGQEILADAELEAMQALTELGASVLVLNGSGSGPGLRRTLRAGARGVLPREMPAFELVDAIRRLVHDAPPDPPTQVSLGLLTERQRTVALLVAQGLSNAEIAGYLFLSVATVKSHLNAVLRRFGLRSRTQLAVLINDQRPHGPDRAAPGENR